MVAYRLPVASFHTGALRLGHSISFCLGILAVLFMASTSLAITGFSDSSSFTLDTRSFTVNDSPFFTLDTRNFTGNDSPLFTLDTRVVTSASPLSPASRLISCMPNPFNPSATIRFEIAEPGTVRLEVYDVRGRLVRKILNHVHFDKGMHSSIWRGRSDNKQLVASGVYLIRFQCGKHISVEPITLLK